MTLVLILAVLKVFLFREKQAKMFVENFFHFQLDSALFFMGCEYIVLTSDDIKPCHQR